MAMKQTLRQYQGQRQLVAPVLQAGLNLLRMPLPELLNEIEREIGRNPFLIRERGAGLAALPGPAFDEIAARPSLVESLRQQIGLMNLPSGVRGAAEHLAGELREDGYLETPLDDVAAALAMPAADVEAGLHALQCCEPAGVGARSLSECLALQLVEAGVPGTLAPKVVTHLEAFVEGNWSRLRRALGLPRPELERIAGLCGSLAAHPVPATEAVAAVQSPDLVAERRPDGTYELRAGVEVSPGLRIDNALMANAGQSEFAAACRSRAEALIGALAFRGETLRRIGHYVIEHQHRFFSDGDEHLRPLSRATVARALGLHPSTVGRAVAGKAMDVDGRLLPLERFFSAAIPQARGADLSGIVLRRKIARIIADEDPQAPLSDAAIQSALRSEGVDIARRTVAKYREWMRLPSSRQRRRPARFRAAACGGKRDARPD